MPFAAHRACQRLGVAAMDAKIRVDVSCQSRAEPKYATACATHAERRGPISGIGEGRGKPMLSQLAAV